MAQDASEYIEHRHRINFIYEDEFTVFDAFDVAHEWVQAQQPR